MVTEIKKSFMMSGKVGTSKTKWYMQKVPFYDENYIKRFRTIAYVVNKQSGRKYILLQGLFVPSVKTTTCVCNRFKMNIFFQI